MNNDNIEDDFNLDFDLDFDLDLDVDLDFDLDLGIEEDSDKKYHAPKKIRGISDRFVTYSNAEKLANDIDLQKDERTFCVIRGDFVFGDLIEALIVKNTLIVKKLTISTLSLNQNNVDSLVNLLEWGFVKSLDIIISDYFYSHERNSLVKYMYQEFDKYDFQLAVCRTHTKITLIETEDKKIVIHGSANLRSSDNVEAISIEENEGLFDFNKSWHDAIIEEYKTVNKSLQTKAIWQAINQGVQEKKESSRGLQVKQQQPIDDHRHQQTPQADKNIPKNM